MGYVLPVQNDGYTQYANRTLSNKERIKLEPVMKPSFYKVDSQYSWEEIQKNNYSSVNKKGKEEKKVNTISEYLLEEITGKGKYINETV